MSTCARRSGGFTVIELIAVLGILGLVSVFFLPVWVDAQADSRYARCAEGLARVGRAVQAHAGDHEGRLPGCQHSPPTWLESLGAYSSNLNFICPEEPFTYIPDRSRPRKWSYALNDFLTPHPYGARELDFSKVSSIPSPAQTLSFAEAAIEFGIYDHFHFADGRENGFSREAFAEQVDIERHSGAANYLFADGHVEGLAWSSGAKPKLSFPGSRFVHPAGNPSSPTFARR